MKRLFKCWSGKAIWLFTLLFLSIGQASAKKSDIAACSAVFPDGAQTNNNGGEIRFYWSARIKNNPDNVIAAKRILDNSGGTSCDAQPCTIIGDSAEPMEYDNFPRNSNDVQLGYRETRTIYPGDYDDIQLHTESELTLMPGDYRIRGNLFVKSRSKIKLGGSGVVRLLLNVSGRFESGVKVNDGGSASRLVIYARRNIDLYSSTEVTGFIYAKENLNMQNESVVNGAVSAKRLYMYSSRSTVNYLQSEVSAADFGDLCGGGDIAPPPAEENPPAGSCEAYFSDGAQAHGKNSKIKFEYGTQIVNSPDNILNATKIEDKSGGVSCGSTSCTVSFTSADPIEFSGFSKGGSNIRLRYRESRTLAPGNYAKLEMDSDATLTLQEGDYYFSNKFTMGWGSSLVLPNTGVVRIFVANKFEGGGGGSINGGGDPERLLVVAKNDVKFKTSDVAAGFFYSQNKVELSSKAVVTGSVSGKEVKLKSSNSRLIYDQSAASSANFSDVCGPTGSSLPTPVIEYRFDDCDVSTTLVDNQGAHNATPHSVASSESDYVVGRALDLSADRTDDWVSVPRAALNGLNDFSVAVWIKTAENKGQQEIFQALGSSTGDDELEIYLINNKRVRIQVQDEDAKLDSSVSLTDNAWHHLVLTRHGEDVCLYVDGALQDCDDDVDEDALDIRREAVVIGQEQDSYAGGFDASQSFEGLMDEFKVYNRRLSASQISTIHSNEKGKLNADGSTRAPLSCQPAVVEPVLDMRFDETSWVGAADEIKDSSGNNNHGSIVDLINGNASSGNVSNIADGKICRAGNIASNNGTNDYYSIDTGYDLNDLGRKHTVSFWYRPSSNWKDGSTRVLMDASSTNGKDPFYYLSKTSDGKIEFGLEDTDDTDFRQKSDSYNFAASTWIHFAVTVDLDNESMKAYVNGVKALERSTSGSNKTLGDLFSLYLGDNRSSYTAGHKTGKSALGDFDELLIFNQAFSDAQISSIYTNQNDEKNWDGSARECAVTSKVDYYGLTVSPATALTCEAATVTVTAYDKDGNAVAPDADTMITISGDQSGNTWSKKSGAGASPSANQYTFTGTESSMVFNLARTTVTSGAMDIDVTDGEASDKDGTVTDPDITFVDAGFLFYADNSKNAIGTQIAGKESILAPGAQTLQLRAVKTNSETGACEARLTNTQTVKMAYQCQNPSTCQAADLVTINNSTTIARNPGSKVDAYTDVTLNFGSNGQATFTFDYRDVGQISLHATKTVPAAAEDPSVTLSGSSNNFVVRPFGFYLDIPGNPAAADASGGAFKVAGETFATTLKAVLWQAADDDGSPAGTASDGIPDRNSELADNAVAKSFGRESSAEGATITHTLVAPKKGVLEGKNPSLSGSSFSGFSNGVKQNTNLSWNEVGIIAMTAQLADGDYLGSSQTAKSAAVNVGRFYPKDLFVSAPSLTNRSGFSSCSNPFTYMGEGFKAEFSVTARKSDGSTAENYTGSFAKLNTLGELNWLTINKLAAGDTLLTSRSAASGTPSWPEIGESGLGVGSVTLDLTVARSASVDGPFATVHVAIDPNDGDVGVASSTYDLDTDATAGNDHISLGITSIRYGRLAVFNTNGPETSALNQLIQTQYHDGSQFIVNPDDTCTTLPGSVIQLQVTGESAQGVGVLNDLDIGGTDTSDASVQNSPFAAGVSGMTFTAPGAGNTGTVTTSVTPDSWLRFDWDGSGADDTTASGDATFGRFRGHDRVIYWLEQ